MAYSQYPSLNDSRVVWLQVIPEHWRQKRLKFATELINEKVDVEGIDLPYLGLEHIESWTGKKLAGEISASEGVASMFSEDDVLFGKLRPYLAKVHLAEQDGLISSEALVIRCRRELRPDFLKYYFLSRDFINIVDSSTYGSKMPRASWDFIGNLPTLLPEADEQKAIARFLDYKTAQIDALIAKKQALLEKLAEKRTALISHAVTKGLDPSVPMKDSGVAWLGKVPKHWKILPLKYAVMFQRGHDLPSDDRTEGSIPLVSSSGISSCHDVAVAKGPGIVTGRYGTIGKFTYVESDYWPLNTTLYSIDTHGNNTKYLWFMLHLLSDLFVLNSKKGAVPGIDRNDLHPVLTVIPPRAEQDLITEYLEAFTVGLAQQVAKVQEIIERLQEYRSALITNAVTGKIDVRNFEIPPTARESVHA